MIEQLEHFKNPYELNKKKKDIFDKLFLDLTNFHKKNNLNYKKFLDFFSPTIGSISDAVPLPVRIFKDNDLKTSNIKVIKELNSSGTSGSKSKIYLDKENSINQSKDFVKNNEKQHRR